MMCRQTVATLASYRSLWQAILDKELCLMAELRLRLRQMSPNACLQMRVDGIIAQMPKKEKKRLLAWGDETWPSGGKKYKVEEIEHDSRSIITVGTFHPVCTPGEEPVQTGAWQDLSLDEAATHMRERKSIALLGMGGTGKTYFLQRAGAGPHLPHLRMCENSCRCRRAQDRGSDKMYHRRAAETLCGPRRHRSAERVHS